MTLFLDEAVADVVNGFKTNGKANMWENTLLVFLADNGGPVYYPGGASNFPLRGGKYSDWDGGVRTAAFLSGGAIHAGRRGTSWGGVISIADWYATLCELAGVDTHDAEAEEANKWLASHSLPLLPAVDSVPQWKSIMSGVGNGRAGNLHLSENALLRWPYKLVTGLQPYSVWTGQLYPNCTTQAQLLNGGGPMFLDMKVFGEQVWAGSTKAEHHRLTWTHDCGEGGCLVNLEADPTEHDDLAQSADPAVVAVLAELRADLARLNKGIFRPDRGEDSIASCRVALENGGYYASVTSMTHPARFASTRGH